MLRFTIARDVCSALMRTPATASCLAKGNMNRIFLAQSGISVQKVNFFTKSPYRKDVPLPEPSAPDGPGTVDLDKWKAVMRLKAVPEEDVQAKMNDEVENEEETTDKLSLEATRELVTMWRYSGKKVPQEVSDEELQTLAELTTKSARKKYLKFLSIKEGFRIARKEKQLKKKAEKEARREGDEDGEKKEKENKSHLNVQFRQRSLDNVYAWRCAQAMIFDQPLVFDLSYEGNMTRREIDNTVTQLMESEAWNRRATEPYHLHFCNLQSDSSVKQQLMKLYGPEVWDRLFITSTDKQHFEVFPREQLVYLTADSPNVLRTYDHNKVYIIGGMVDRSIQPGLSLANAKRFKLATARLPLDDYLYWETGGKNLTLDQMIRIMLTIKETGNWKEALQFVPARKHDGLHPHLRKETETVMNKQGNMFRSEAASFKDFKPNNTNIRSTFNRPKAFKPKTAKTKQATKNRDWWNKA